MRMMTLLGLAAALAVMPALAQGPTTTTPPAATPPAHEMCPMMSMTPEQRAAAMQAMQDLLIMSQNTAVWATDRLYVLQGNRVLEYSADMRLVRTSDLPVPAVATAAVEPATPPVATSTMLRSQVPTQLIPITNGLIVVRGRQVVRLNRTLQAVNVATLPELPQMTAQQTAAACPVCSQAIWMQMGLGMTTGVAGTTETLPAGEQPATATPPAADHDDM